MKLNLTLLCLGCGLWAVSCSSIPVPSLPSLPSLSWSSSEKKPDPTAEALFDEGMRYFKDKRYTRAIDNFSKIKSDYPFSPLLTQTELQLADAYYLNEQYPEAINAFKEFESMHPSNENMAFVTYRLGQSYFDQFTTTDRDQKNTETAKGYFEGVLAKYPKSQYAADAKEKLAKCNGYLAEHDFNIAQFYLKQEKYPAARDRFEEIVRRYQGTPAAAKSLFFLGESYRKEKNNVKAALAYEALVQHYPDNPYAAQAKSQLAQIEKEKQDPLAMLLMRDRRPSIAVAEEGSAATTTAKAKEVPTNLVAKTEMVYEEPGAEKGMFSRVVDKINPFSSSGSDKKVDSDKDKKDTETTIEQLAKRKAAQDKQESPGMFSSIWHGLNPFSGKEPEQKKPAESNNSVQLVQRIDASLQSQGIDSKARTAALTPPPAIDLPKPDDPPPPPSNTAELLGRIDSNLKKEGRDVGATPQVPEEAQVFKDIAAAQARAAKAKSEPEPTQTVASSGLLGAIDQKLQSQGVEPNKFATASQGNAQPSAPKPQPTQKVELEPKVAIEKGPLFLAPTEVPAQDKAASDSQKTEQDKTTSDDKGEKPGDSGTREIPKALIKGPSQPQPAATVTAKSTPAKGTPTFTGDEDKGVLDTLKEEAQGLSKILNPFQW